MNRQYLPRPLLLVISILLGLTGCHEYEDHHYHDTVGHFEVSSWDGGYPVIIDPYVNDGVFEISWSLKHLYAPTRVIIRLGKFASPTAGDVILAERYYDIHSHDYDVTGWQAFQYDSGNEIWRLEESASLTFIADITHWFPYGEVFYVHFDACQDSGECYRASQQVVLW